MGKIILYHTQPIFYSKNFSDDAGKLLAILIVISVFIYDHRYTFLTLANNINQAFNLFKAIRQTWLYWQYQIKCLVNPFQYGPG